MAAVKKCRAVPASFQVSGTRKGFGYDASNISSANLDNMRRIRPLLEHFARQGKLWQSAGAPVDHADLQLLDICIDTTNNTLYICGQFTEVGTGDLWLVADLGD